MSLCCIPEIYTVLYANYMFIKWEELFPEYEQTSEEECSEDFLTWIKITHSQKKKKKEKHKNRMVSGGRLGP